jgi:hypothetical protein
MQLSFPQWDRLVCDMSATLLQRKTDGYDTAMPSSAKPEADKQSRRQIGKEGCATSFFGGCEPRTATPKYSWFGRGASGMLPR